MTLEQNDYGKGWDRCSQCGVKDRVDELEKVDGKVQHKQARAAKCAEWKATLQKAKPADVAAAGVKLAAAAIADQAKPTPDELLAELHAKPKLAGAAVAISSRRAK